MSETSLDGVYRIEKAGAKNIERKQKHREKITIAGTQPSPLYVVYIYEHNYGSFVLGILVHYPRLTVFSCDPINVYAVDDLLSR